MTNSPNDTDINLSQQLDQFHGTQAYHQWSILCPHFVLTDGAKYLADQAGAYWLMDLIASHQLNPKVKRQPFQVWFLVKRTHANGTISWLATGEDGNNHPIAYQTIEYSDFPLDEIKLYAMYGDGLLVIMLPGEY